jgi:hypothetical protein
MTQRDAEPVFCSECQNEVKVESARMLDGHVLCPADLRKKPLFERMRARRLPEDARRRGGAVYKSFFTASAALMLVVGASLVWSKNDLAAGIWMVIASIVVAFFGVLAGDVVDLLLDIFEQLKQINRK